jgi:hypothetical protein
MRCARALTIPETLKHVFKVIGREFLRGDNTGMLALLKKYVLSIVRTNAL